MSKTTTTEAETSEEAPLLKVGDEVTLKLRVVQFDPRSTAVNNHNVLLESIETADNRELPHLRFHACAKLLERS